jgi:hypothetical protein
MSVAFAGWCVVLEERGPVDGCAAYGWTSPIKSL